MINRSVDVSKVSVDNCAATCNSAKEVFKRDSEQSRADVGAVGSDFFEGDLSFKRGRIPIMK